MRTLGLILLIGGFLIKILTALSILSWVLMGLGVVIIIVSYATKRK